MAPKKGSYWLQVRDDQKPQGVGAAFFGAVPLGLGFGPSGTAVNAKNKGALFWEFL